MGFLNPLLLWGTALVGVPILIYLINLRRYRRLQWAAMEFLLRALKKHRRRIQLENLLLLLLRVSIILLLALAMARPFLRSQMIGTLSKEKEENWIFAIDTSGSMGFKEGPRSLFENARDTVSDMVGNLVKNRDRVAMVTLDAEPRVLLSPMRVTESNRAELLAGLGDLALGTRPVDLPRSLEVIREVAGRFEPAGPEGPAVLPKRIILFSDFQRRDWLSESGPKDPASLELIREIQEARGQFALADLKGSDRNMAILDLTISPEVIARDVWVQIQATVRNFGASDFDGVELSFKIDGQDEVASMLHVPAGESVTAPPVPYRFSEAGYHSVTAEIRSDGLALDNRRYLAVRVLEEASILLLDGEPGGGPMERETLHLAVALAPDAGEDRSPAEGRGTPYRPVLKTADQLEDLDPREFTALILANVGYLPERFFKDLKAYVRDGGALMVFLGKNVDPAVYNQEFAGEDGKLFPGKLLDVAGDQRSSFHLVPGDPDHPLVRYFEERRETTNLFSPVVEFRQFFRSSLDRDRAGGEGGKEAPAGRGTRVVFRLSDPEGSPLAIDLGFGLGRVLWFLSTADREWNDLAGWPDFIAFLYEAIPYLIRSGETRINLGIGEPYRQVFEAADYAQSCILTPPESSVGFSKAMTKLEGENRFAIVHEETWAPGIYDLRLSRPGTQVSPGRESRIHFAVNVDPREGDLRPLGAEDLRQNFPILRAEVFDAARELREIGREKSLARGTEIWRGIVWGALILLFAETALAGFLGRRER